MAQWRWWVYSCQGFLFFFASLFYVGHLMVLIIPFRQQYIRNVCNILCWSSNVHFSIGAIWRRSLRLRCCMLKLQSYSSKCCQPNTKLGIKHYGCKSNSNSMYTTLYGPTDYLIYRVTYHLNILFMGKIWLNDWYRFDQWVIYIS